MCQGGMFCSEIEFFCQDFCQEKVLYIRFQTVETEKDRQNRVDD